MNYNILVQIFIQVDSVQSWLTASGTPGSVPQPAGRRHLQNLPRLHGTADELFTRMFLYIFQNVSLYIKQHKCLRNYPPSLMLILWCGDLQKSQCDGLDTHMGSGVLNSETLHSNRVMFYSLVTVSCSFHIWERFHVLFFLM